MKKLLCFVFVVGFSLFASLFLCSCSALSEGGGLIGKILPTSEQSGQSGSPTNTQNNQSGNNSREQYSQNGNVSSEQNNQSKDSAYTQDSQSVNDSREKHSQDGNNSSEQDIISEVNKEFYTLSLVYNNGEQDGKIVVEKNAEIKLQTPVRMGYTFKGWDVNGDILKSKESITIVSDQTAYATWEINKYKIEYNLSGGTLKNAKEEFTIDDLPLTLASPEAESEELSFVKWATDEGGEKEISVITRDETSLKDYSLFAFYENSAKFLSYRYNTELGGYEVSGYSGSAKSVTIPSNHKNVSVTSIGDRAFQYCSSLTSITIPDSVTSIGEYAFDHCSSLTSITIPDSVTSIGYQYTFHYCSSLTSVTFGESSQLTSIGYKAFWGCSSLTSINIPDSVTSIRNYAFCGCSSLTSITIPDSVTSIGEYAFDHCSSLTSITIPDSVTSIGSDAFSGCSSLKSIIIPDSVTSIDYNAFRDCLNLKTVFVRSERAANKTDTNLFDYAETVYIKSDITVTNSLFGVVMKKDTDEPVIVDGVEYYKYVLKS